MTSKSPTLPDVLADPLSAITRLERRNLIATSFVVTLLAVTGSYPLEFATFGIKFDASDLTIFKSASVILVLYFLIAFMLSAFGDFMVLKYRYHEYKVNRQFEAENHNPEDDCWEDDLNQSVGGDIYWVYRLTKLQITYRGIFEFVFPIGFAFLAIGSTIWRAYVI